MWARASRSCGRVSDASGLIHNANENVVVRTHERVLAPTVKRLHEKKGVNFFTPWFTQRFANLTESGLPPGSDSTYRFPFRSHPPLSSHRGKFSRPEQRCRCK
jgi:hypothetical protein